MTLLFLSGCVSTDGSVSSGVGTIDIGASCKVLATDGSPFTRPSRKGPGFFVYAHGSGCPRTLPDSDIRLFKVLSLTAHNGYARFTMQGRTGVDTVIVRRNTDKYPKSKYKLIFIAGD